MKRQAKVTRTLEDGSLEEFYIDLDKPSEKGKVKSSRKKENEDETSKKQKEKQTPSVSKATVGIERSES